MARALRGYTLVELLVASFVFSLLLTAVTMSFVATGRLMNWVQARSTTGSDALLSLYRISGEVNSSSWSSITVNGTQMALMVEDPGATDLTKWNPLQEFVIYYYDGTSALMRKVWFGTNPSVPLPDPFGTGRLSAAQLNTIVNAAPNGTEHQVAGGVSAITLTPSSYPTTTFTTGLTVQLTVQQQVQGAQTIVHQQVQTTMSPRNHL